MIFRRDIREVVLDVETTGFSPDKGDRVIEIGAVELKNYQMTGEYFHTIINPERIRLSRRITEITGIAGSDLVGKPKFEEVAYDLREFIGASRVFAHNASFDRRFVNFELERANQREIPSEQWDCTLRLAKSKFDLRSYTLDALCEHLGISLESREKHHGALIDCRLTAQLYARLMGEKVDCNNKKAQNCTVKPRSNLVPKEKSAKQPLKKAKSMRQNFNTPIDSKKVSKRSANLDGIREEIEEALTSATGFDVSFGKNLPKNISAASQYFPIAILAMQLIRVAYAKIRSGREPESKILNQMDRDKAEILTLIEMGEDDVDAMYEKLHAFHRSINQRR